MNKNVTVFSNRFLSFPRVRIINVFDLGIIKIKATRMRGLLVKVLTFVNTFIRVIYRTVDSSFLYNLVT